MANFGRNMKLTIDTRHKDAVRAVFTKALAATHKELPNGFELFLLEDGFNIGVYFADGGGMSENDAKEHGVWLEFAVADKGATHDALKAAGVDAFDYEVDQENNYYMLPGGPVFRLSAIE